MSVEAKITQWHHDRNLIEGSTDKAQFTKLLEELCELWAALNPGMDDIDLSLSFKAELTDLRNAGRIFQPVTSGHEPAKLDALGDMSVVMINMAARSDYTLELCQQLAYDEIKDRKGRMVDGVFVKEVK